MAEYDLESWTSPDLVKADDISVLRRFARSVTQKRLRLQQNSRKELDAFLWSLRCDIVGRVANVRVVEQRVPASGPDLRVPQVPCVRD